MMSNPHMTPLPLYKRTAAVKSSLVCVFCIYQTALEKMVQRLIISTKKGYFPTLSILINKPTVTLCFSTLDLSHYSRCYATGVHSKSWVAAIGCGLFFFFTQPCSWFYSGTFPGDYHEAWGIYY